ncbi:MAG: hypothetical protein V4582_24305 [Pseudomonadota bacterium]
MHIPRESQAAGATPSLLAPLHGPDLESSRILSGWQAQGARSWRGAWMWWCAAGLVGAIALVLGLTRAGTGEATPARQFDQKTLAGRASAGEGAATSPSLQGAGVLVSAPSAAGAPASAPVAVAIAPPSAKARIDADGQVAALATGPMKATPAKAPAHGAKPARRPHPAVLAARPPGEAAPDSDVTLLAALVAHQQSGAGDTGPALERQLAACRRLHGSAAAACGQRVCAGPARDAAACASAPEVPQSKSGAPAWP